MTILKHNNTISRLFFEDAPASLVYFLTILLATSYFFYLYPLSFLLGHGFFFTIGDASQHVSGWLFYMKDEWRFPLLYTERVNYPEGVSIAFMDIIPFAALLLKPIAHLLPEGFHYIGIWQGIAYLSQAIAAVFLIRALGYQSLLASLAAVFFAMTWSSLGSRMGHTALMTHSLLLFSLAFYFLGRQGKWQSNTTATALIALNAISLLIHPYLLAMCYGVFLAFLVDQTLHGESWKKQVFRLAQSAVIFLLLAVILGYIKLGSAASGFGHFSMNLAAPFCGGQFLKCTIDANGGQYEGFNYLGIGTLILLLFALITQFAAIKNIVKQYAALIIMAVLSTIYAVSNEVFLASYHIIEYPIPYLVYKLTQVFQASGRFFWIVGYLILFAALAGVFKYRDKKVIVFLLLITIPLQWMDLQPIRNSVITKTTAPNNADDKIWSVILSPVDRVNLFPLYGCSDTPNKTIQLLQRLAAQEGKMINTGYIARYLGNCKKKAAIFHESFQSRQAYILPLSETQKNPPAIPAGFSEALLKNECMEYQEMLICIPGLKQSEVDLITKSITEEAK